MLLQSQLEPAADGARSVTRTLNETKLSAKTARSNVAPGLYWRGIGIDVHFGYRKHKHGGTWLVRYYARGIRDSYNHVPLGIADEVLSEDTLSYEDSMRLARETIANMRRGVERGKPDIMVKSCVEACVAMRDERAAAREQRPVRSDASYRFDRYVLEDRKLPSIRLDPLISFGLSR